MNKQSLDSWLKTNECVNVQMPNEIFEDFSKADFKSYNHKCFAYAYYYLVTYLYRNALYGGNTTDYSQHKIINVFTSKKSSLTYITKSGGLLDEIGYTRTTTDYPVSYYMEDGILEFGLIKNLRKKLHGLEEGHSPSLNVKEPVKAMDRFDGEHYTGTFYSFQNTHKIDVNDFIRIISDGKLGHVGLYLYGYISMMCDRFPGGYQVSNATLGEVVECSESTIKRYARQLEVVGLLKSKRKVHGEKLLEKVYSIS